MASFSKRVVKALEKEFVEGAVFRVDLDRVDVAPDGSAGILHSLPLVGDRDKIKAGDTVRVMTIAGQRVALAGDVATSEVLDEITEDASLITLAEMVQGLNVEPGGSSGTPGSSDPIDAYSLQGLLPAASGLDAHVVISDLDGTITPNNITTPFLTVGTQANIETGIFNSAQVNGNVLITSDLTVNGIITAGANTNLAGPTCGFSVVLDGAGSTILTSGSRAYFEFPYSMRVNAVDLIGNQSGNLTVSVYKSTSYATLPSWVLIGTISITGAQKNTYALNNTWDAVAGNFWAVNVTACTGMTMASLNFKGYRV